MDHNREYHKLAERVEREIRKSDNYPTEPMGITISASGEIIAKEVLPKGFVDHIRWTYQLFDSKDIGIAVSINTEEDMDVQFIFTTYGVCIASCLRFKDDDGVYKRKWDYPWFPRQEYSRFYGIARWD